MPRDNYLSYIERYIQYIGNKLSLRYETMKPSQFTFTNINSELITLMVPLLNPIKKGKRRPNLPAVILL